MTKVESPTGAGSSLPGSACGKESDALLQRHCEADLKVVAARAKKRGGANPDKSIGAYRKNVEKRRKIVAGTGRDVAAYRKALWENLSSPSSREA